MLGGIDSSKEFFFKFLQKYAQISRKVHKKWCHLNFDGGFEIRDLENHHMTVVSSKSNEADKLT